MSAVGFIGPICWRFVCPSRRIDPSSPTQYVVSSLCCSNKCRVIVKQPGSASTIGAEIDVGYGRVSVGSGPSFSSSEPDVA